VTSQEGRGINSHRSQGRIIEHASDFVLDKSLIYQSNATLQSKGGRIINHSNYQNFMKIYNFAYLYRRLIKVNKVTFFSVN